MTASDRHLCEARELLQQRDGQILSEYDSDIDALASAIAAAELRGVRAGLAAARLRCERGAAPWCIDDIDPANVDVPEEP